MVESDAELQANTCIDRASIGETRIGQGAKLDNLVHIGHSCTIGHDTLALRPGRPGRHYRRRQQRHPGRTSRRQRPRKNRRRSHSHSPKRHPPRRSRRSHGQRRSRHRSQIVVKVLRRLRQAAGDSQGSKKVVGAGVSRVSILSKCSTWNTVLSLLYVRLCSIVRTYRYIHSAVETSELACVYFSLPRATGFKSLIMLGDGCG